MRNIKLVQEFFCYILVVLTKHLFENLHISPACLKKEENDPPLQNIVLSHDKTNFYLLLKIQMLQLVMQVTHEN